MDVIGLSLPNISKPYIHDGVVQTVVLWSTHDLGYLTVYAGSLLAQNKIPNGATSIQPASSEPSKCAAAKLSWELR